MSSSRKVALPKQFLEQGVWLQYSGKEPIDGPGLIQSRKLLVEEFAKQQGYHYQVILATLRLRGKHRNPHLNCASFLFKTSDGVVIGPHAAASEWNLNKHSEDKALEKIVNDLIKRNKISFQQVKEEEGVRTKGENILKRGAAIDIEVIKRSNVIKSVLQAGELWGYSERDYCTRENGCRAMLIMVFGVQFFKAGKANLYYTIGLYSILNTIKDGNRVDIFTTISGTQTVVKSYLNELQTVYSLEEGLESESEGLEDKAAEFEETKESFNRNHLLSIITQIRTKISEVPLKEDSPEVRLLKMREMGGALPAPNVLYEAEISEILSDPNNIKLPDGLEKILKALKENRDVFKEEIPEVEKLLSSLYELINSLEVRVYRTAGDSKGDSKGLSSSSYPAPSQSSQSLPAAGSGQIRKEGDMDTDSDEDISREDDKTNTSGRTP